jgi:hypothetical protein
MNKAMAAKVRLFRELLMAPQLAIEGGLDVLNLPDLSP